MTCEQARDLAAGFVLGALEADEEAAVREHLATCDQPHPEFGELGSVVALLAESLGARDLVEPPPALRARILAAAAADLEAREAATGQAGPADGVRPAAPTSPVVQPGRAVEPRAEEAPRPRAAGTSAEQPVSLDSERTRRRRQLTWVVGLAAVLAIAVLGAWNVSLQGQLSGAQAYRQHVEQVLAAATRAGSHTAVLASPTDPNISGLAVVGSDGSVSLVMRGLTATTGTRVYEAWVIPGKDATPVPIGSFAVSSDGTGYLAAGGAPAAAGVTVALTLEDGPGATTPKPPIISAGVASS
jgi:hypothetical protein